jgi:hypothetical protein
VQKVDKTCQFITVKQTKFGRSLGKKSSTFQPDGRIIIKYIKKKIP